MEHSEIVAYIANIFLGFPGNSENSAAQGRFWPKGFGVSAPAANGDSEERICPENKNILAHFRAHVHFYADNFSGFADYF